MNSNERDEQQAPERLIVCTDTSGGKPAIADWAREHMKECDVEYVRADLAATRMRDKCVDELRGRLQDPSLKFDNDGFRAVVVDWTNMLITRLESLTLGQGEQKQS